jgi:biotin carboxyl carrier protein
MPGKVVKISCKVGDQVKAGQALLVIEAMKMENELRSPGAGKVAEIAVREGQTVEGGQLLVGLTPQG